MSNWKDKAGTFLTELFGWLVGTGVCLNLVLLPFYSKIDSAWSRFFAIISVIVGSIGLFAFVVIAPIWPIKNRKK